MTILLGIISFHLLVLLRTQLTHDKRVPYGSLTTITLLLVIFVMITLVVMKEPEY